MQYYQEQPRKIPIKYEVDVLVLGGGPGGFAAAVNAARQGAKTMLIEQSGNVGGVATTGLMSHWTSHTEGGFYEEILERGADSECRQVINPEKLKNLFLNMLAEEGVILQLYSFASETIIEDNTVKGVIVESKSGREAILASVVIDATGDGDIAARAGVPYEKGRTEDGGMQPMTLMFKVGGVDLERALLVWSFESTTMLPEGDLQKLAKKHLPFPAGHVLLYPTSLPGVVTCNMTNCIDVDGTKVEDLTRAEYECRSQIEPIIDFLRDFIPGYESCYLLTTASIIGVRETRRLEGGYTLTEEDILSATVFPDWVVTRAYFKQFDVHNVEGPGLDQSGIQTEFPQRKGYTIPYRCFVPNEIDNLFFVGRNISGTHLAHSNYRVMPIVLNMGLAVGIAAALCAELKVSPRALDPKLVQDRLVELGVTP